MKKLFLIRSTEDETFVEELSQEELRKRIEPDENGEFYYGERLHFLNYIPESYDGYWQDVDDNAAMLIRGEIIVPKAKKVVIEYDFD